MNPYLRVQLRAVVARSAVQGDDLVAHDVVTRLEVLGDCGCGREVGFDQVVGGPGADSAGGD